MVRLSPSQNRDGRCAERTTKLALDTPSGMALRTDSVEQEANGDDGSLVPEPARRFGTDRPTRHLRRLQQRRVELLGELAACSLEFHDSSGNVPESDQPEYRTSQSVNLLEMRRLTEALRGIEAAIARAAAGSYGLCSDCGQHIPAARLRVNPAATRCIACQERSEM